MISSFYGVQKKLLNYIVNFKRFIPRLIRVMLRKFYFNTFILNLENLIFRGRFKFRDFDLADHDGVVPLISRSLIRHNLYEKYELEAINKLDFRNENFIDLGSSIGITSMYVASMNKNKIMVLVEPARKYIKYSKDYITSHLGNQNKYIFINKAIYYGKDNPKFMYSANSLEGKLNHTQGYEVGKTTLNEIIKNTNLDSFNLLIDLEGYSFEPLFKEPEIFANCNKLVIEDKFNEKFSQDVIFKKLHSLNFSVVYIHEVWGSHVIGAVKNL